MEEKDYKRFSDLTFDDFRQMAKDSSLSVYEKIGFPNEYRQGKEHLIFDDIVSKLPLLKSRNKVILDIGPGCSELPQMLINLCQQQEHTLILVDSEEMLSLLPEASFILKIEGFYPKGKSFLDRYNSQIDVIIAYSMIHYVFSESNIWDFLDCSLELLAAGGQMLIGDIPNISKRKRFFNSSAGIEFHQQFTGTQEIPQINFNTIERHKIDDAVLLSIINRARNQGFDGYLMPQPKNLPMANRREDILITKP